MTKSDFNKEARAWAIYKMATMRGVDFSHFGDAGAEQALEVADAGAANILAGMKKFEAGPLALAGAALWIAYKAGQKSSGKPTGLKSLIGGFLAFRAMNVIWTEVLKEKALP